MPGQIKVVWHREMLSGGKLGQAVITRKAGKWFVCFQAEFAAEVAANAGPAVGIDLGLNSLIATSEGETVQTPRFARKKSEQDAAQVPNNLLCRRFGSWLGARGRLPACNTARPRTIREHPSCGVCER